jgi:hypothetical protein
MAAARACRRFTGFDAFYDAVVSADSHARSLKRPW